MYRLDDFFYGEKLLQAHITKTRIEVESLIGVGNGMKFYTLFIHYDKDLRLLRVSMYCNTKLLKEITTHAVKERVLNTILLATIYKLTTPIPIQPYRYYTIFNEINTIIDIMNKQHRKYIMTYIDNVIEVQVTRQIGYKIENNKIVTTQKTEHNYNNPRELLSILENYLTTR